MARPRNGTEVLEIPGFHGGVQYLTDPDKLKPEQATRFINWLLDELGTAKKRLGCSVLGTVGASGDRALSGAVFQRAGQTTQYIVHLNDGTVRYSTDLITWTTMRSSLSTTSPMSFCVFTDLLFMTNGVNDFYAWNGTTGTAYASVPKFKYLTVWKDTLWGGNDGTNPHRVYSSAAADGTTWPAANFVDVGKGQGLGISGLSNDANALVIFKHLQVHALYDPVEFTNRIVDPERGCISHFGIIKHDGLIYFPSHEGICVYLGDAPSKIVSQVLQPLFDNYIHDETNESLWWGYSFQNRVGWCWARDSATDFQQIEFYPSYPDSPWIVHDMPARVLLGVKDTGASEKLYGFSDASNQTLRAYAPSTYTDLTATITAVIQSGWFDYDYPGAKKYMDRVMVTMRGDATLDILTDFDPTTAVATHSIVGGTNMTDEEVFTDLYFRAVAFRITNNQTTGESTTVYIGNELETIEMGGASIAALRAFAKPCGDGR